MTVTKSAYEAVDMEFDCIGTTDNFGLLCLRLLIKIKSVQP